MKPVFLHQMSWIEAKEILTVAKVVVVVTGAIEQHGPHLPLGVESTLRVSETGQRAWPPGEVVNGNTVIGFGGYAVSKTSKQPELAKALVGALTSEETQKEEGELGGGVPGRGLAADRPRRRFRKDVHRR